MPGTESSRRPIDQRNAQLGCSRPSVGVKEFWRTGLVAGATSSLGNVTTNDEFEADWVESQQDC